MELGQLLTLIGVQIGLFAALATLIIWVVNKLDNDVKSVCSRLDGHASRIDQLYRMFIDLLKEVKK